MRCKRPRTNHPANWPLIAILLVSAALRLVALDTIPPGPGYDELQNTRLAERVLAGQWAIYFPENHGQEPLYPVLEAWAMRLLGRRLFALRLPGAAAGALTTPALYLVGRRLAGRRPALLAAAFHALSFWPLIETRMALETSLLPPLAALAILFMARGLTGNEPRPRRLLDFALAGGFLGGHVYAYTPGRAAILLPFALLLYLLLLDRPTLRRQWAGSLLSCLAVLLIAAPLFLFLRAHPEAEQRLDQLGAPLAALQHGDPRPVLQIAAGTLGMFAVRGDPQWLYNVADRPLFDPLTALFFCAGLALCLADLRRWRRGLLLLWLLVGLSPAMVSPPPASFTHTLVAQPAIYLILAVGVDAAWSRLTHRRARPDRLPAATLLVLNAVLSTHACFVVWANAPEVHKLYQGGISAVARALDAQGAAGPVAIGAPYINYWHPWNALGFEFQLRRADLRPRWFNPAGAWVWPAGAEAAAYYFPSDPLGDQTFDAHLRSLFLADAVPLPAADGFTAYRLVRPAALGAHLTALPLPALAWPPEWTHLPLPTLPVTFGQRFALIGIEQPPTSLRPGDELRLVTYWQVLTADPSPIVAFVHVTPDGQAIWGQTDWLDVRMDGLQPGDRFAQLHRVPIRPDAPPGPYHLQLGLYAPDTLLRLSCDAGPDRLWVASVEIAE